MVRVDALVRSYYHNASLLPQHISEGLLRYVEFGVIPGDFLCAVLEGNLFEACARADHVNRHALPTICTFISSYSPVGCWGSREKLLAWSDRNGLQGKTAEDTADE